MQVVPTVGASDDKAVGRLLRHFTLLTDTTASKAKFLATLTRGKQAQFKGPRGDDGTESGPGPSNKAAEVIDGNSDDEDFLEIVDVAQADGASDQLPVSDEANAAAGVETLVSLSGGALAPEKAQELLNAADGDVGRAADLFFSGSWQPPLSAGTISNGNGKGVKGGEMPKKRAVAPSPGEAENGKRRKGDAGQRSILSFLGKEDKRMTPAASPKPVTEPQQQQSTPAPSPPAAAPGHSVPLHTTPMSVHKQGRALSQAFTAGDRSAEVPPTAVTLPLAEYNPISHAPWAPGEPTPYLHIARTFEAMDSTTKRLRISDALTNAFRSVLAVAPQDAVPAAYLAVGKVGPDYEGMELNVGGSTVAAAVSECTGVSRARLRSMYNELGDLGDVAAACKRTQATLSRPAPLTVPGVFSTLRGISVEKGQGAAGRRQRAVLRMLRSCREAETKYLVRTLVQALRVGANWRSVVPALAKAVCIHQAQAAALQQLVETAQQSVTGEANPPPLVKSLAASLPAVPSKAELDAVGAAATAAFHLCPNLELLLDALLAGPACEVAQRCHLTPGIPIKPMLAKISEGIADAVAQLKGADFLAEYKYDGVRAQIHVLPRSAARQGPVRGGSTGTDVSRVKVFSRNSEDRTASFPDVAAQVLEAAQGPVESFIIDAEVVSVERPAAGGGGGETAAGTAMGEGSSEPPPLRLRAFQELASRPRSAVETSAITVDVCVFVFDILEADGQSLLELPLSERRAALLRALPTLRPGYVQLAQGVEIKATDGPHGDVKVPKGDPEGKEEDQQLPEDEADPVVASAVSQVQSGLMEALACGAEGLMLKSLTARYEPSKRSEHWIKLKRDYCIGLHDTLDLVPIGAWYGSGRKAGWFSPFLMAVWDPEAEEFQSLCRCMSGFSDVFYAEATAR